MLPRTVILGFLFGALVWADDSARLVRVDHSVAVRSTVPAMAGRMAQIYVREVARAGVVARGASAGVVLFVHGAGTPGEVAFDVPYQDYSWMAYLANAGFDVFAMDMTGYGRSTRPYEMNDRCNLPESEQKALFGSSCTPSYSQNMTTLASDWNDIGGVVDHLRALRRVDKVHLIGWSLGGPRAGGYAAANPDKVSRLVLLAPAYRRGASGNAPAQVPAAGSAMSSQSAEGLAANWDRQIGCPDQLDPNVRATVWREMQLSDPQGASWGPGIRRAPLVTTWGWNEAVVRKHRVPALLVAPDHDKQVPPAGVRSLYDDWGAPGKVFAGLACTSHNALWERNHALLFQVSLEWLRDGKAGGVASGAIRLGDATPASPAPGR